MARLRCRSLCLRRLGSGERCYRPIQLLDFAVNRGQRHWPPLTSLYETLTKLCANGMHRNRSIDTTNNLLTR